MEKMRNIIRIKDVPSNTIEEAIIILKENKKVKKYEAYNKFKNSTDSDNDNGFVIKEAEFIISDYLKNNEAKDCKKQSSKIKQLRIINILLIVALIISIIL